jgi:Mn-containing catalase
VLHERLKNKERNFKKLNDDTFGNMLKFLSISDIAHMITTSHNLRTFVNTTPTGILMSQAANLNKSLGIRATIANSFSNQYKSRFWWVDYTKLKQGAYIGAFVGPLSGMICGSIGCKMPSGKDTIAFSPISRPCTMR